MLPGFRCYSGMAPLASATTAASTAPDASAVSTASAISATVANVVSTIASVTFASHAAPKPTQLSSPSSSPDWSLRSSSQSSTTSSSSVSSSLPTNNVTETPEFVDKFLRDLHDREDCMWAAYNQRADAYILDRPRDPRLVNSNDRYRAVTAIIATLRNGSVSCHTAHLAVELFDRFTCSTCTLSSSVPTLTATCLMLAEKLVTDETYFGRHCVSKWAKAVGVGVRPEDILTMERLLLHVFDYRPEKVPTAYDCLMVALSLSGVSLSSHVYRVALEICNRTLLYPHRYLFRPTRIAFECLLLAANNSRCTWDEECAVSQAAVLLLLGYNGDTTRPSSVASSVASSLSDRHCRAMLFDDMLYITM